MMTAAEIRREILSTVATNGGHLASSLGAVEIAIALAKEFDPAKDRIVWDVGHQAYAWKLLTGRKERFSTLRKAGGLSGFPNPAESECDAAVAGHAGVALSVALGMAAAGRLCGDNRFTVAVTGDSSLVNGTSFEALNNAAAAGKIIVILNDNDMSISKPAGSFSRFLGRLIAGAKYNSAKNALRRIGKALKLDFLYNSAHGFKAKIKAWFLADSFFEQFGFRYLGPVDGHDVDALCAALEVAKSERRSVIIHAVTKKGKGFAPAEKDPTAWHGVGPGRIEIPDDGSAPVAAKNEAASSPTWSDVFGDALCELAEKDDRIVALTAGMKDGTGLENFAARFKERFFDVGISEGHMVAFAAGLAARGLRPVVAVYSTFLQRAVDQVMHDVAISSLPVVFCVDRAGVVGADGVTHQGLYDIPMLRCLPNLAICQPKDARDLAALLDEALSRNGPTVIRYPRGKAPDLISLSDAPANSKVAVWATGDMLAKASRVAAAAGGITVHARYLKPFDSALLARQREAGMKIISIENGALAGGFGEAIGADLRFGWPDEFIPHGSIPELEKKYALDEETITAAIAEVAPGDKLPTAGC